jgi:hypothetical protein
MGLLLSDSVVDRHSAAIRLVRLADQHDATVLERACQQAFELGDLSPPTIRNVLKALTVPHSGCDAVTDTASSKQEWPMFARSAAELVPMTSIQMAVAA